MASVGVLEGAYTMKERKQQGGYIERPSDGYLVVYSIHFNEK